MVTSGQGQLHGKDVTGQLIKYNIMLAAPEINKNGRGSKMKKELKDLINEIEEARIGDPDLYQLLTDIYCDKLTLEKIYDMLPEFGKHLPFDLILKLNIVATFPVEEIEDNFEISGFDEWYKETYGGTVE